MLRSYFKRVTLLLLIFIMLISSIGPINIVLAESYAEQLSKLDPVEISVSDNPGSEASVNSSWVNVGDMAVLAFKLSGNAEAADTYKIPMIPKLFDDIGDMSLVWLTNNSDGTISDHTFAGYAEDMPQDAVDFAAYKTLKKGEVYYITVYGKNAADLNADGSGYDKLAISYYSDSEKWISSLSESLGNDPPGTTGLTTGGQPELEEEGTKENPYLINGDTEINYAQEPFYFMVSSSGKEGTYIVNTDYEKKIATFKYVDDKRYVGFYKEHTGGAEYNQFGTETIELTSKPLEPTYNITSFDWGGNEYKLVNGYRGASITGDIPYPSAYVFVRETSDKNARYCFKTPEVVMEEKAGFIEETLTRLLLALGTVFLLILQLIIGKKVTIDSIIFNDFNQTVLDFFGGTKGTISNEIAVGINYWFKVFQYLAMFFYLIMLVYVGMKVILASTGAQKGKYKEAINSWLVGLLLLFFLPYALRYIMVINNELVKTMGENRQKIYTYYNAADIKKMEMDGKYAGGDAITSDIDKLKQLEQDLEENLTKLTEETNKMKQDMVARMGSFYAQLYNFLDKEHYDSVREKIAYLRDVFIPENSGDWSTNVEKKYQEKLDEIVKVMEERRI